jgi:hypothetical protein
MTHRSLIILFSCAWVLGGCQDAASSDTAGPATSPTGVDAKAGPIPDPARIPDGKTGGMPPPTDEKVHGPGGLAERGQATADPNDPGGLSERPNLGEGGVERAAVHPGSGQETAGSEPSKADVLPGEQRAAGSEPAKGATQPGTAATSAKGATQPGTAGSEPAKGATQPGTAATSAKTPERPAK